MREGGRTEPNSTNLDIYAVAADGGAAPANLTAGQPGHRHDAGRLARRPLARLDRDGAAGYEADRQVVQLRNLQTGETRALTQAWDRSVGSLAWAPDGRSPAGDGGRHARHAGLPGRRRAPGGATRLTQGGTVGNVVPLRDGSLLYTLNSLQAPDDLYRWTGAGASTQLTRVNADRLAELDPVTVQRFSFPGAGGDTVWGQIVKPAATQGPLPVAFLIHGGPQARFGNGWSYRWNPWLFAAPGYAAVTVDFHGSTGYGQAFTDSINRDWGGAPLEDLRLGLAAAGRDRRAASTSAMPARSAAPMAAIMVNWIAGQWPDGFRCLVSHSGIFDQRAMAYETEELWFTEWEFGGPYFEPAGSRATMSGNNPVHHRPELADADARHPRRARFPDPVQPVARRVQRAAAAEHPVAAGRLPGRESLDPEAAKLDPMVSRGAWLAGSVAEKAGGGASPITSLRAKRSNPVGLVCFVASLLAMTGRHSLLCGRA